MAILAERLPILPIPKQLHVSPMEDDVIHDSGQCHAPGLFASDTEGIIFQVGFPDGLPLGTVAPLGRRTARRVLYAPCFLAVLFT